jgi:hypothetical protein
VSVLSAPHVSRARRWHVQIGTATGLRPAGADQNQSEADRSCRPSQTASPVKMTVNRMRARVADFRLLAALRTCHWRQRSAEGSSLGTMVVMLIRYLLQY